MTVQLLDQFGNAAVAGASGLTVNLSSNSGTGVFRDTADTTNLNSVAIASGRLRRQRTGWNCLSP